MDKVFKHKQLELQLAEAKMAQQHLQFNEDKEKTLTENQLVGLMQYHSSVVIFSSSSLII